MCRRIELLERFISNSDEIEYYDQLGIKHKEVHKYRRTLVRLDEIDRPMEIPGNKKECRLLFYSGEEVIVKESYDDLCIRLNDMENAMYEEDEQGD